MAQAGESVVAAQPNWSKRSTWRSLGIPLLAKSPGVTLTVATVLVLWERGTGPADWSSRNVMGWLGPVQQHPSLDDASASGVRLLDTPR